MEEKTVINSFILIELFLKMKVAVPVDSFVQKGSAFSRHTNYSTMGYTIVFDVHCPHFLWHCKVDVVSTTPHNVKIRCRKTTS